MRKEPNLKAEKFRNHAASHGLTGVNMGAFHINGLNVIVSNGGGWDHVSVSMPNNVPSWGDMCSIKDLFFKDDEVVMQLHPAKIDYVDIHSKCLHLWRPQTEEERKTIMEQYQGEAHRLRDELPPEVFAILDNVENQPTPGPIPLPMKMQV